MKVEATHSTISAPRNIFWKLSCVCSGTQRPLPSWWREAWEVHVRQALVSAAALAVEISLGELE